MRGIRNLIGIDADFPAAHAREKPVQIGRLERGLRAYTQDTLEKIASALQTDAAALLSLNPKKPEAIWAWLGVGLGLVSGGLAVAYTQAGGDPCVPLKWAEKLPLGLGTWVVNNTYRMPEPIQERCYPRRAVAGGI